jgi:arginine/lysine/histidine/glutamine transport system substrate-binding/permease protein
MMRLIKSFGWLRHLVLSLSCLLLVIACNNSNPNSTNTGNNSSSSKILKVATDPTFAPFEYQSPDGKVQGFDIDLMNSIGKSAGFQIEYQNMPFDGMIVTLQTGRVDAGVAGITITPERLKVISFSKPYIKAGLALAVGENNKEITKFDNLKNKKIAVQIGTTGADEAKKIPGAKISTFKTPDLALQELANGNVDAVVNDAPVTLYALKTGNLKKVKVVGELLTEEYYGIATPKNSPNLEAINKGLDAIIKDGTYAQIYKKWFNSEPPKLPDTVPAK